MMLPVEQSAVYVGCVSHLLCHLPHEPSPSESQISSSQPPIVFQIYLSHPIKQVGH